MCFRIHWRFTTRIQISVMILRTMLLFRTETTNKFLLVNQICLDSGTLGSAGSQLCHNAENHHYPRAFGSVGQCFHRIAERNTGLQAQARQAFTEYGPNRQGHEFRLNSLRN